MPMAKKNPYLDAARSEINPERYQTETKRHQRLTSIGIFGEHICQQQLNLLYALTDNSSIHIHILGKILDNRCLQKIQARHNHIHLHEPDGAKEWLKKLQQIDALVYPDEKVANQERAFELCIALSAGIPIIGEHGDLEDIITDGVNGFLTEYRNRNYQGSDYNDIINLLQHDKDLLHRMSQQASETCEQK